MIMWIVVLGCVNRRCPPPVTRSKTQPCSRAKAMSLRLRSYGRRPMSVSSLDTGRGAGWSRPSKSVLAVVRDDEAPDHQPAVDVGLRPVGVEAGTEHVGELVDVARRQFHQRLQAAHVRADLRGGGVRGEALHELPTEFGGVGGVGGLGHRRVPISRWCPQYSTCPVRCVTVLQLSERDPADHRHRGETPETHQSRVGDAGDLEPPPATVERTPREHFSTSGLGLLPLSGLRDSHGCSVFATGCYARVACIMVGTPPRERGHRWLMSWTSPTTSSPSRTRGTTPGI